MNDFLQNILNSDIKELKEDFSLHELYTVEVPSNESSQTEAGLSGALVASSAAIRDLNVVQLKPISIRPQKKNPQIVNVKQTFRFPNNFITNKDSYPGGTRRPLAPRNMYSQTSKTIMEIYETQKRGNEMRSFLSTHADSPCPDSDSEPQLQSNDTNIFRNRCNVSYTVMDTTDKNDYHLGRGAKPVEMVLIKPKSHRSVVTQATPYFIQKKKRPGSKRKYTRNARSRDYYSTVLRSPKRKTKYPASKMDGVVLEVNTTKDCYQDDTCNTTTESTSSPSNDSIDDDCSIYGSIQLNKIIDKMQDNIWEVNLHGIYELMEVAGQVNWKKYEKHMTIINRKMIDFLKSPRSSLCRSACQATGELFREAKSTKRPEFDEIVDILLCKTADLNRFIQKDANVALDKLVTYIPISHTVRALSAKGPSHKNPLVRTATARLLVCICALSGLDPILGTSANPRTRKAILVILAIFLTDKNLETRKYGERLYRMLRKHKFFNEYFYKDMDSNCKANLKRILKDV
ncbi:uncharacterized protein LOC129761990 [Toxorhynchites rutilus septentrionalis]|uniref:uncharacterized protein LOC129761990 n=1 Tax=Toxorhynchites rutilus septentrionalis TaxID=329112 RepID=UPI0024786720|nr:uncharacterized protein LOC129761990 [Toxorhynchites rutilus septentrionalis]